MHFKTPNESGNDTQQYCYCISYAFCCCLLICPLLSVFFWCFLIFSDFVTVVFCLFCGQCPFLTTKLSISPFLRKKNKTGGYFFWRLEMNTLLMEPCETIPKTGNVWERGGTWNIAIDHAFQNTKRIRKWYSTVLLLYFLRVLLLPSDLHFAFYVFSCFLTFSDCVTIEFCFFLANVHVWQKMSISINRFKNRF